MVDRRDDEARAVPPDEDIVLVEAPSQSLEEILAEEAEDSRRSREEALRTGAEDAPTSSAGGGSPGPASVREELAQMRDRHLRTLAEFDNFRKRTEREKAEYFKYALSEFVRDLLPVLDNFERAIDHAPSSAPEEYHQGIVLIYRQLLETLSRRGVTEVPASGAFDPNLHEAVAREETEEVPPNTILEVLQKGYYLHDRLLRPAFVKVAVAPAGSRGGD
jgi:molecular chaperone GrpE